MSENTFYLLIFIIISSLCFMITALFELRGIAGKKLYISYIIATPCLIATLIIILVAYLAPPKGYEVVGRFTCKTGYYALYIKEGDDIKMIEVDKLTYENVGKGNYYELKK